MADGIHATDINQTNWLKQALIFYKSKNVVWTLIYFAGMEFGTAKRDCITVNSCAI